MKFVCEKCNKKFDRYEDCAKHEFSCTGQNKKYVHLKYIMIEPEIEFNDVYIYDHPKAIHIYEDKYILSETHRYYGDIITEPEFDTIKINDDENPKFYIVTENLDPIYENECIAKLLNHKLIKAKEEYEKFGETIKNFSNRHYSVERETI